MVKTAAMSRVMTIVSGESPRIEAITGWSRTLFPAFASLELSN